MTAKRKHYEQLISRLSLAIDQGFYLEAIWLAFAVIEDRAVSLLDKTGGVPKTKQGYPVGLDEKTKEIKRRRKVNANLLGAFPREALFTELSVWRKDRNRFAHALATNPKPWQPMMDEAKHLAVEGNRLCRDVSASVARFKKRLH